MTAKPATGAHGLMGDLPLTALLSAAYVAFVIEADNLYEARAPHRTNEGGPGGPWLISLAMWANCLVHLPPEGLSVRELEARARMGTNVDGMRRWGYVRLRDPQGRPSPRATPRTVLAPTAAGLKARAIWAPIPGEVEDRWRNRYGSETVGELRRRLVAIGEAIHADLPESLPILHYGLVSRATDLPPRPEGERPAVADLSLSALLARELLAIALAFEAEAPVSLAIAENVLARLGEDLTAVRALPAASGVSKEALAMALGWLERGGLAETLSTGRLRAVRLTPRGLAARDAAKRRLSNVEREWRTNVGPDEVDAVRGLLAPLATGAPSPLLAGCRPPAGVWRSRRPAPVTLPRFPMVLHRGGYPDGS